MKKLILFLLGWCAFAQAPHDPIIIRPQSDGTTLATRAAGIFNVNCATGITCTWNATTSTMELSMAGGSSNTILSGTATPIAGQGINGDFYLKTDTSCLYGPKAAGAWPGSCVSLVGAAGATGATGAAGQGVASGGTSGQVLAKNSDTNYDTHWIDLSAGHTQNTDTGTTSATFQLNSGSSGPKLKDASGVVEIRNAADSAYASIKALAFLSEGAFEAAGQEQTKPTAPASGSGSIWFDSVLHLPQYQGSGGTVIGTMVVPDASRTANQFCTHINSSGVCVKAAIAGADLPNPGASTLGGVRSIDCTGTGHLLAISTSGIPSCSADSGGTSVNVNGSAVASPNFNATTPAAATGYKNVAFQVSGSSVSGQVQKPIQWIDCTFDGGGGTITANAICYKRVPEASTIIGWDMEAVGSSPGCTIDVLSIASGATLPTASITASATPALTSTNNAAASTSVSTWNSSNPVFAAHDIVAFKVLTPGNATWAHITLYFRAN